jgi:squalene-associated FAD-dependent desaturase
VKPAVAKSVAVVGAGWAGLACAVALVDVGCQVTVFEASKAPGGRARSVAGDDALGTVDNGQHVLIGPYRETFALMDRIGVDRRRVLRRLPLALRGTDGLQLNVPAWPLGLGSLVGLLGSHGLGPGGRRALLRVARSVPATLAATDRTVATWLSEMRQPDELVRRLWAPLCVAALNTPAESASARVFARVLHDGLLAAGQTASIEVPARPLGQLLPEPAVAWLQARGAAVQLGWRVKGLAIEAATWRLETTRDSTGPFDAVVVAVAPHQAAALIEPHTDVATLAHLRSLEYQAIATVHLQLAGPLPAGSGPLLLLHDGPGEWLIDHGDGRASVVVSAWRPDRISANVQPSHGQDSGSDFETPNAALDAAVRAQLHRLFPALPAITASRTLIEKRATFACTPGLQRPGHCTGAQGLWLTGDFTAGPYPATLEGAVRSGLECARHIAGHA